METRIWLNRSQPQMLYNATLFLYFTAALALVFGDFGPYAELTLLFVVARVAAGYGIANERRWGYHLGLVVAFAPAGLRFILFGFGAVLGSDLVSLMFEALLIYLLVNEESRAYQRIWFK